MPLHRAQSLTDGKSNMEPGLNWCWKSSDWAVGLDVNWRAWLPLNLFEICWSFLQLELVALLFSWGGECQWSCKAPLVPLTLQDVGSVSDATSCSSWRWVHLHSFRFSAAPNRTQSFQLLCHSQELSLLLLFPGNLKTNYKRKNNNLQVFVRLHIKSSVSLTPTFSTHIFLRIIICIASGLPFLKY